MSMVSFALRVATVRALRGVTLAGQSVLDSPVDPSATAAKAGTPSVFVYSDAERLDKLQGRNILEGTRNIDLSLLIVLPPTFSVTVGGSTVVFEDRKAGAATAIDIIYRQIETALLEESNVWASIWLQLVNAVIEVEAHAYVLPVDKNILLPARAIRICIDPLDSPQLGLPPCGVWADLIAAMTADPGLAPLAPHIAAAIEGTNLPQWRVDAIGLGDTVLDTELLGDAPLGGGPTDDVVPMTEATLQTPDDAILIQQGIPSGFEDE